MINHKKISILPMIAWGFIFALIGCGSCASTEATEILNVRTMGAIGDGKHDDTQILQKAIDLASRSANEAEVFIPAGHYRLEPTITGARSLLAISRAHDVILMGEAGTILEDDSGQTFLSIMDSSDITVSQIEFSRTKPRFAQATILGVGPQPNIATIAFNPGYDDFSSPVTAKSKFFIVFDRKDASAWGHHDAACGWFNPNDPSVCWPPTIVGYNQIKPGIWQVKLNTSLESRDVGNTAVLWNLNYKGHAFVIVSSHNVSVDHIDYYPSGTDGGFVLSKNSGVIAFRNFVVDVRPHSGQLISAMGGAMVFNNHIKLILDHVRIARVWDDALNMGANYARIHSHPGANQVTVDCRQANDWQPGDTVSIWDWGIKKERTRARITDVSPVGGLLHFCLLGLDQNVAVNRVGSLDITSQVAKSDNIDRIIDLDSAGQADIQNSYFQSLHARDLLIKASPSIIQWNVFADTVMAGIFVGPQFSWDEGPTVDNVTIDNNRFVNVSGSNILFSLDGASSIINPNIVIRHNTFAHFGQFRHGVMGNPETPISLPKDVPVIEKSNQMSP